MAEPTDRLARLLKTRQSTTGINWVDPTVPSAPVVTAAATVSGSAVAYTTSDDIADADARTQNEGTYHWWAKEF